MKKCKLTFLVSDFIEFEICDWCALICFSEIHKLENCANSCDDDVHCFQSTQFLLTLIQTVIDIAQAHTCVCPIVFPNE